MNCIFPNYMVDTMIVYKVALGLSALQRIDYCMQPERRLLVAICFSFKSCFMS